MDGSILRNTHATRIADLEGQLRHAISVFRSSPVGPIRAKRAKAVRALAKRLVAARARWIKARIAAAPVRATEASQLGAWRSRLDEVLEGGVEAILAELGVQGELE